MSLSLMNIARRVMLVSLAFFCVETTRAQICSGCVNVNVDPTIPPPAVWFSFGPAPAPGGAPLIFSAGASITVAVTSGSGLCALRCLPIPQNFAVCENFRPCTPTVKVTLSVGDQGTPQTGRATFSVRHNGTICNMGHLSGGRLVQGSLTYTPFDQTVSLSCGQACGFDANYDIACTKRSGSQWIAIVDLGSQKLTPTNGSFDCSKCSNAIFPCPPLGGGG